MREVFISFILSLIFFGLFVYCRDNLHVIDASKLEIAKEKYSISTQTEFVELYTDLRDAGLIDEVINKGNLTAMGIIIFGFVLFTSGTIHLFIDKMFFKKFYEKPDLKIALRRSTILTIAVLTIIYLKIYGFFDILVVLFVIVVSIFIEIVIGGAKKQLIDPDMEHHE